MTKDSNKEEYIYITIPTDYVCIYHKILGMLADYGEDILKDCKAYCTNKNINAIECFNLFNSAIAARKLGKFKLAETIIKFLKAKINQIYGNNENTTNIIFPVDDKGKLKSFVSCKDNGEFYVDIKSGNLYRNINFDNNDITLDNKGNLLNNISHGTNN